VTMGRSAEDRPFGGARASGEPASASRDRELFPLAAHRRRSKEKIVSARCRTQHAGHARAPERWRESRYTRIAIGTPT
jgi:hypothetical protein